MRIRKHAKISPLLYTSSSLKPGTVIQTHICQLNQSPWDAMSFSPRSPPSPPPPPPSQVITNGNDNVSAGSSSIETIQVFERENYNDRAFNNKAVEQKPGFNQNELVIQCIKSDGKSWRCPRKAEGGNSLCLHHLSLVKSYNSSNHSNKSTPNPNKSVSSEAAQHRPRRPRKTSASSSSSSNPYEFYYYSGFGPRWGKRRGETKRNDVSGNYVEHEHGLSPIILSQLEREMDYTEDEDEDDHEEDRRKKPRKPVKERSLKSLM